MKKIITEELMEQYKNYLQEEERSKNTIQKYMADIRKLMEYAGCRELSKGLMLDYKEFLIEQGYGARSIN